MANTVKATTLLDSTKRRIISLYVFGADADGDETDTVIYDFSADTNSNGTGSGSIDQIWFTCQSANLILEWDGATDYEAFIANQNDNGYLDYRQFGGIPNKATTPTGDLTLTTAALGDGDRLWAIIDIKK